VNIISGRAIIPYLFNAIIFITPLFLSTESFAQGCDPNEQSALAPKEGSFENEDSNLVELDTLAQAQSPQVKESPLSLKDADDTTTQEGIQDAFSRDRGDRFSGKK
jgi:hypothetical protein